MEIRFIILNIILILMLIFTYLTTLQWITGVLAVFLILFILINELYIYTTSYLQRGLLFFFIVSMLMDIILSESINHIFTIYSVFIFAIFCYLSTSSLDPDNPKLKSLYPKITTLLIFLTPLFYYLDIQNYFMLFGKIPLSTFMSTLFLILFEISTVYYSQKEL